MNDRGSDWYRRPELILADVLQRAARQEGPSPHYYRATVLAVDTEGGLLQNEQGAGSLSVRGRDGSVRTFRATTGVRNPRGAVKARILTNGMDRLLADDELRVFWPMFPTDQIGVPISPGEHVYVVFEGEGMVHGLWISRVSGQDSANAFIGSDSYTEPANQRSAMDFFEENPIEYPRTDEHAGQAPPRDAVTFFTED